MRKGHQGFSLVEVITSTVIVSILAAGIFSTLSFTKRMQLITKQKVIAMSRAEARVIALRETGISQLSDSVDNTPTLTPPVDLCYSKPPYCEQFDELNNTMKIFVSTMIKDVGAGPTSGKEKEVVVRADWMDPLGMQRTESIATYIQG